MVLHLLLFMASVPKVVVVDTGMVVLADHRASRCEYCWYSRSFVTIALLLLLPGEFQHCASGNSDLRVALLSQVLPIAITYRTFKSARLLAGRGNFSMAAWYCSFPSALNSWQKDAIAALC